VRTLTTYQSIGEPFSCFNKSWCNW